MEVEFVESRLPSKRGDPGPNDSSTSFSAVASRSSCELFFSELVEKRFLQGPDEIRALRNLENLASLMPRSLLDDSSVVRTFISSSIFLEAAGPDQVHSTCRSSVLVSCSLTSLAALERGLGNREIRSLPIVQLPGLEFGALYVHSFSEGRSLSQ